MLPSLSHALYCTATQDVYNASIDLKIKFSLDKHSGTDIKMEISDNYANDIKEYRVATDKDVCKCLEEYLNTIM